MATTEKEKTNIVKMLEKSLKLDRNLHLTKLMLFNKASNGIDHWEITAYFEDGGFVNIPVSEQHLIEDIVDGVYDGHKIYKINKEDLIDGLYAMLNDESLNLSEDNRYNIRLSIELAREYGDQPLNERWEE